jgi:hypothetical protein
VIAKQVGASLSERACTETGRQSFKVLAKDICNPSDPVEVLEQRTCFVVGGGGLQAAAAK